MQGKAMHIRQFGDPVLRRPAEPVHEITDEIRAICSTMVEAMIRASGAGLAAPQIGIAKRIIVLDVEGEFHILINPELISVEGESDVLVEGCLSLPGVNAPVTRGTRATISGTTLEGERIELTGEGLLARAIQHEMDHLNGHLFIDHLSPARRRSAIQEHKRRQRREEA
jgi:peptide deformylase